MNDTTPAPRPSIIYPSDDVGAVYLDPGGELSPRWSIQVHTEMSFPELLDEMQRYIDAARPRRRRRQSIPR